MRSMAVKRAMRDLDRASKFFGGVKQKRRRERLNPKLILRGAYFVSLLLLYLLADRLRRLLE